ncbi:biogenesis of lysosome-related organelles complex 1 subunit 3 [Bombyx mori]|uniref:Biogenesis of lysosome-related organelles complex 1 subunit 3 n=1 Tax=Bombyx mori TaxID=7091 RepID=A0A8R2M770_BOMMO|nr:biogenesis of lysosome-related organelles complex 1 subunit 3-like [Bombyx mori]
MSKNAHVVDGEASESDSELEIGRTPDSEISSNSKTFVVTGEAEESDDESKIKPADDPLERDVPLNTAMPPHAHTKADIYNSLLHQKLWECNVSLRATIQGLVRHTTEIASSKLTYADKTLLNVQESVRATNANLSVARARLRQIQAGLERANCATALQNVKIKDDKQTA